MKKLPTILEGDESNKISSKRVITFLMAITFVAIIIATTFFGFVIDPHIYDGLVDVLVWSLGFIGSEQFASAMKSRRSKTDDESDLPPKPGGEDREQF